MLVTGDRNWMDCDRIVEILSKLPTSTVVVHGACRGADLICAQVACELGMLARAYPAKWNDFGLNRRAAGVVRNKQMLDREHTPDEPINLCIAFHNEIGSSRGTRDMIRRTIAAKIPTLLVTSAAKEFIVSLPT